MSRKTSKAMNRIKSQLFQWRALPWQTDAYSHAFLVHMNLLLSKQKMLLLLLYFSFFHEHTQRVYLKVCYQWANTHITGEWNTHTWDIISCSKNNTGRTEKTAANHPSIYPSTCIQCTNIAPTQEIQTENKGRVSEREPKRQTQTVQCDSKNLYPSMEPYSTFGLWNTCYAVVFACSNVSSCAKPTIHCVFVFAYTNVAPFDFWM